VKEDPFYDEELEMLQKELQNNNTSVVNGFLNYGGC